MEKTDLHKIANRSVPTLFAFLAFSFLVLYFSPIQGALIFLSLFVFKVFSAFFVKRCTDSFLNLLRCVAMMMVYILHTLIFTNSRGVSIFAKYYMRIFYTPAWGGVWIFFVLSGYLAGKGFSDARYGFDMKSICRYYSNKFLKVIVLTFSFIFLCCVLIYPSFIKNNPIAVFSLPSRLGFSA